ncbi:PorP/SprF family type IX secretion system membrane protein [Mucilaginibacter robiniae]|uniref:PorP/SprF family type IX secretion system membrane protein n=1 Tax=Mucilaginibacter robiniae TaxID=2728022 RepID=A0A7L5E3J2_9SPHI|nr:PorP/SprF family type IX secretion system membrane protein [Mucilaginibacter robiniae]QJD96987.1 PorP/SprF family type IX secretion system membrane protein [Mucilaginibacter robiniae]
MKKITQILILLLVIGTTGRLQAQVDPHFSQYYAYPLWLNPALTGVFNGQSRFSANYKNQWATVNQAYQTTAASGDFKTSDKLSLGFTVLDQSAGGRSFNYFDAYGSLGYGIAISNDGSQRLSFGLQAGLINRSFDMSKLQFGDQYNPGVGFDPSLPSYENFSNTHTTVFDANAGIFYYDGNPNKTMNAFGGVSVGHLSRPKDGFSADNKAKIPLRYDVHGGIRIHASDYFDITPHALYIKQQNSQIEALGVYSELKVSDSQGLMLGGMFRWNDAAVANVGYHINSLLIGASYDFNTSSLNRATSGQGGIELSISYVFSKHLQLPEPVCPRL